MGILATLVQSFFDFNLQNPASGVLFWIAVGFLEVLYHAEKAGPGTSGTSPLPFSNSLQRGFGE